jgi:hypothetical protein
MAIMPPSAATGWSRVLGDLEMALLGLLTSGAARPPDVEAWILATRW